MDKFIWDPSENADVISLVKQADGNWKGFAQKFGNLIEVREVGPQDCLSALLTHDGKESH